MTTTYLLERAWVDGMMRDQVGVEIADGRFTSVTVGGGGSDPASPGGRVPGLTVPGLANCHSHAFHRALRGRAQRGRGTFWTWREQMYDAAGRLTPDSCFRLARAAFREMVAAGFTSVGEFHYLHHQPDGTPYDDPNAMGLALIEAAREAGIRLTLLDTCYLSSGFGKPVEGVQRRFSDGELEGWAERMSALHGSPGVRIGGAYHSVRAVPLDQMRRAAAVPPGPLHVHLSEQPAENEECLATYGLTPTQVLDEAGHLGPQTSVVHATHLTDLDLELLGEARVYACLCPTTERDLADGIGPARRLQEAGARLSLGSDSHAVVDPFEEMRAVELDERLVTLQRGHWTAAELLAAGTAHAALGWPEVGRIEVGAPADLVTLDPVSPRTAGTGGGPETVVYAATAADVTQVMVDGRIVFRQGDEEEIGRELERAIAEVWA